MGLHPLLGLTTTGAVTTALNSKNLFVAYRKFKLNWTAYILSSNPIYGPSSSCLFPSGLKATLQQGRGKRVLFLVSLSFLFGKGSSPQVLLAAFHYVKFSAYARLLQASLES